jgi:TRAP-type C4-dicarboxylate transport system permease small subunit
MERIRRFVGKLSTGLAAATKTLLGILGIVLIVVVGYAVVMRYVFNSPPTWSQEASTLLFVWISFLGASLALQLKGHVTFDFIIDLFPGRVYNGAVLVKDVLTIAVLVLGFLLGLRVVGETFRQFFQSIPVSFGFLYTALPLNFLIMVVHALDSLLEHLETTLIKKALIEKPQIAE